jgi:C4-dicarboxylate-binding protein DctP
MRLLRFWLALLACLISSFSAAGADTPIVIKLSHASAPGTPRGLAADRFRELAETRTNGAVKVEVYPDCSLYPEANELEALMSGAVQMVVISTTRFATIGIPDFEVLDLPFVTPNTRSFHTLSTGPIGMEMLKALDGKGLTGLSLWDGGFRVLTTNRRIRETADFKGLKVRAHVSKIHQAYLEGLGMRPQWTPLNELPQALKNGSIDAINTIVSNVWTKNLMEQQQYAVMLRDTHQAYVLAANKKFWDSLPADTREALEDVVRQTKTYADALAEVENRVGAAKIRNYGKMEVVAPSAEQIHSLKLAAIPLYRTTAARLGRERIESVLKLSGQTMPE